MPERATVTQGVQIGVETTPGTAVASNKQLVSIGIDAGIQADTTRFRPMGQKFASMVVPNKEWVEADISGVGSYSELPYILSSLFNYAAPVQQGATTAYLWTHTPAPKAEDTIKTYTVEQGGAVRAHKYAYGLMNEFNWAWSRAGVELGGSMLGQRISDNITMTGSPSAIEERPVLPNEIDVFLDTTSGGIGTTKLTRVFNGNISFGNRFGTVWPVDSSLTSFGSHVELEPAFRVEITQEADSQGMAALADLRAATTKFMRVSATSPLLAGTAFPYKIWWDMAVKVADVAPFADEDGVYAIKWTYEIVYDATWGKAITVANINKQTTL